MKPPRIFIALFGLVLAACSPRNYVKRQLEKHPEWAKDSVILIEVDTVRFPMVRFDTAFKITGKTDTFRIQNDTINQVIIINPDSLRTVTIFKEKLVPYTKTVYVDRKINVPGAVKKDQQKSPLTWWEIFILGFVLFVIMVRLGNGRR